MLASSDQTLMFLFQAVAQAGLDQILWELGRAVMRPGQSVAPPGQMVTRFGRNRSQTVASPVPGQTVVIVAQTLMLPGLAGILLDRKKRLLDHRSVAPLGRRVTDPCRTVAYVCWRTKLGWILSKLRRILSKSKITIKIIELGRLLPVELRCLWTELGTLREEGRVLGTGDSLRLGTYWCRSQRTRRSGEREGSSGETRASWEPPGELWGLGDDGLGWKLLAAWIRLWESRAKLRERIGGELGTRE
ncbi:hypothetical protein E2C01_001075 [Portunus trituberculatus]|uniref:Uncharacterized protein n=1 Tax=Portunus trituberculatus TaxID=210409 RepID=A0A5B7CGY8_PORTR|nr:hypothetical protein [Portunus trituberculatus]